MSVIIHKDDSNEKIQKEIRKMLNKKRKESIDMDLYFGKVNFGVDGLDYQKKIRDQWK